jgi:hypothetical protein
MAANVRYWPIPLKNSGVLGCCRGFGALFGAEGAQDGGWSVFA